NPSTPTRIRRARWNRNRIALRGEMPAGTVMRVRADVGVGGAVVVVVVVVERALHRRTALPGTIRESGPRPGIGARETETKRPPTLLRHRHRRNPRSRSAPYRPPRVRTTRGRPS